MKEQVLNANFPDVGCAGDTTAQCSVGQCENIQTKVGGEANISQPGEGGAFQPGEGPSWGLIRDCEIFANLCLKLYLSDSRDQCGSPALEKTGTMTNAKVQTQN